MGVSYNPHHGSSQKLTIGGYTWWVTTPASKIVQAMNIATATPKSLVSRFRFSFKVFRNLWEWPLPQ